jgi:hypothetical protein
MMSFLEVSPKVAWERQRNFRVMLQFAGSTRETELKAVIYQEERLS